MQRKTKKILAATGAITIAATLVFGSTLAWQSVNQVASNKNGGITNPGGRLHDDFDGQNKDVYVENFGDSKIAIRIQIREFLETGRDAGKAKGNSRTPVDPGADFQKPEKWPVHVPVDKKDATLCKNNFHKHIGYQFGGQTIFLPTFNMNKDSLAPEINGTWEGKSGTPYDDYVKYETADVGHEGTEYYDADSNTDDEGKATGKKGNGGELGVNYTEKTGQTHNTKQTLEGEVITMDTWLAGADQGGKDKKPGNYWVYDKDGWAYWANPLAPQEATGLLLNGVQVVSEPADDYYFAIDVIAQMTTLGDLGENYKDGFWDPKYGTAPSKDAQTLLKAMGASSLPISLSDQIRDALQNPNDLDPEKVVTIDGEDFFVTKITEDNKALLVQKMGTNSMAYKKNTQGYQYWKWDNSDVHAYMNGEWLKAHPTVQRIAEPTTIYTRLTPAKTDWYATTDQIFALSMADVTGLHNGTATSEAKDYTLGKAEKIALPVTTQSAYYWGRDPYSSIGTAALLYYHSTSYTSSGVTTSYYARPAFIVDIS